MSSSSFFLTLVIVLLARGVGAQIYTGTIAGRVTDQLGETLPGVTVTATSDRLLQPLSIVSSDSGTYRLAELPIGSYSVTFALTGFQRLVREGIFVTAGATVQVNAALALTQIAETITVSGRSPAIDLRQTGIPESFPRSRLENIPTARDPWVILAQTPGMVMDRENVGGNESGQQSIFVNRGTDFSQNTWTYDGVNITDLAATGGTPMYFDFGAFEEINVTTGGQDPSIQTAGTAINFIVKQGTNSVKGQASVYGIDKTLQGHNVSSDLMSEGAGAGAPLKYLLDYGFDVGGPIARERLWFWGDLGVQDVHRGTVGFFVPGCTDPTDADCLNDDPTTLTNANVKLNWQASTNNKVSFTFTWNDKKRATRGASDTRPLETTWRQSGPTFIYKIEDSYLVSSSLVLGARFAYIDAGFALDYQDPLLRDVQPFLEITTYAFGRSISDYRTVRPQYSGSFDGNYFLTNRLGADHELKFGFQFKKTPVDSFSTYGGDAIAVFSGGAPAEAWFYRPSALSYQGTYGALHVQDIVTTRRTTLKLGLRYDSQVGRNRPSHIPANRVIPSLMPAIDSPGTEAVDAWRTFSPRVGFTYDVAGNGKLLLRASYARYYDLLGLGEQIALTNGAGLSEMDLPWTDRNRDRFVQANEVDPGTVLYVSNFDPRNPRAVTSSNVRDPALSPPSTDEIIVGIEQELAEDFSFGVNVLYKRFSNLLWNDFVPDGGVEGNDLPFVGVPASAFVPVTTTFQRRPVTYYELRSGFQKTGDLLTNWPDYRERYRGVELTARKRFSQRWTASASFTYADHREQFESARAIYDPTNAGVREDGEVYYASDASGKDGFFLSSRWNFKLDGAVELPWGLHLAGKLNGRQGFPFVGTFLTDNRAGGIGRVEVLLEPIGASRLDDLWVADARIEKTFTFSGFGRLSLMADAFNLFNSAVVLKRERRQNLATANRIQEILAPRVLRLGVRWWF